MRCIHWLFIFCLLQLMILNQQTCTETSGKREKSCQIIQFKYFVWCQVILHQLLARTHFMSSQWSDNNLKISNMVFKSMSDYSNLLRQRFRLNLYTVTSSMTQRTSPNSLTNYATMNNSQFVYTQPYLVSSEVFNKLRGELWPPVKSNTPYSFKELWKSMTSCLILWMMLLGRSSKSWKISATRKECQKKQVPVDQNKSQLECFSFLQQKTTKTWLDTDSRLGSQLSNLSVNWAYICSAVNSSAGWHHVISHWRGDIPTSSTGSYWIKTHKLRYH